MQKTETLNCFIIKNNRMQFHIYRNFVKFVWKNKKSHGHVSCQRLHCICGWTSSHLSAFPDLSTCVCFFWTRFICLIYLFLIHNWTRVFFFVLCLVLRMFIQKWTFKKRSFLLCCCFLFERRETSKASWSYQQAGKDIWRRVHVSRSVDESVCRIINV